MFGERLRIDPRKLIHDENIFVAVDLPIKDALLVLGGGVIDDLVPRFEGDVFAHPYAVDAHIPRAEQAAEGKRALRIVFIGEIS